MMKNHYVWIPVIIIAIGIGTILFAGSEPVKKAPDSYYDKALSNIMQLAGIPDKEIICLLSLPTSPEVDIDECKVQDTTRWFFVSPDLKIGIVFELNGQCEVPGMKVYDLRGKKGK